MQEVLFCCWIDTCKEHPPFDLLSQGPRQCLLDIAEGLVVFSHNDVTSCADCGGATCGNADYRVFILGL